MSNFLSLVAAARATDCSNPLMMRYEGGDLLLTGVAGQRSGRRPRLSVQAVGGGLVGRRLWSVTRAH